MFSQNDEEKIIIDFFGDFKGTFLDIGAYDGINFSNVYKLVTLGWNGTCIEPSPSVFPNLKNNYANYPNINLFNLAVSDKSGDIDFYDSNGDAISSFSKEHKIKWEKNWNSKFTKVKVKSITVSQLFDLTGYDFDFINLDVESLNYSIFTKIPFEKLNNLKLICIEHDGKTTEIKNILKKFNFNDIGRNGENILLGRSL